MKQNTIAEQAFVIFFSFGIRESESVHGACKFVNFRQNRMGTNPSLLSFFSYSHKYVNTLSDCSECHYLKPEFFLNIIYIRFRPVPKSF